VHTGDQINQRQVPGTEGLALWIFPVYQFYEIEKV